MRTQRRKSLLLVLSIVMLVSFLEMLVSSQSSNAQNNKYKSRNFVDASSNNFPPMNVLDKDGSLTGFGRDLADAVVKAIDGKVTHIHSGHWVQVLEWLDSGKADFIHDTGYTKDRDEFLDYSDPIIEMPEVIFVRPDQYDVTGLNSLKGKTVACVNKHITHLYLQTFPEITCHVVKTSVEGLYELVAGKVDAFVYPKQIILYLAQNLRLRDKIKITGEPLRTLTWSMVVKEGNMELLRLLNEGIAKVRETAEYDRIYDKWWGKKVLAGYSKRELQVITAVTTGTSILIMLLISLLFFNYRLSKGRKDLEIEVKERISVEEALRENEYIIESASSVIATADLEGNMTYANPAFLKTWGFDDAEEFLGRPFPEFWVAEDRLDEIMEALRGKGTWFGEIQARRKDGTLFDVQVSAAMVFDKENNPIALTSTSIDITERKRAVEELRLERNNLVNIFEAMEDGVYIVNQQYDIQYVNTVLKKDFGPYVDRKCYEYFHDRKEVCPWCKNQDVFAGKTVRWEWFSFKNQKTYDLIDTPVRNPDGTISKLEIFRDITDRRKAEEELKEHREHLEELVKKRTAELQSIINSMSGREVRMADLKKVIKKLREQIESAGLTPVADDPLIEAGGVENDF